MLTDVKTRQAKPRVKTYKLADGHGLYIEVSTNGGKYWRYWSPLTVNQGEVLWGTILSAVPWTIHAPGNDGRTNSMGEYCSA